MSRFSPLMGSCVAYLLLHSAAANYLGQRQASSSLNLVVSISDGQIQVSATTSTTGIPGVVNASPTRSAGVGLSTELVTATIADGTTYLPAVATGTGSGAGPLSSVILATTTTSISSSIPLAAASSGPNGVPIGGVGGAAGPTVTATESNGVLVGAVGNGATTTTTSLSASASATGGNGIPVGGIIGGNGATSAPGGGQTTAAGGAADPSGTTMMTFTTSTTMSAPSSSSSGNGTAAPITGGDSVKTPITHTTGFKVGLPVGLILGAILLGLLLCCCCGCLPFLGGRRRRRRSDPIPPPAAAPLMRAAPPPPMAAAPPPTAAPPPMATAPAAPFVLAGGALGASAIAARVANAPAARVGELATPMVLTGAAGAAAAHRPAAHSRQEMEHLGPQLVPASMVSPADRARLPAVYTHQVPLVPHERQWASQTTLPQTPRMPLGNPGYTTPVSAYGTPPPPRISPPYKRSPVTYI